MKSTHQDIGYILGKVEMLEKKFDEHREENKKEIEEVLNKLDSMTENMSFYKHTWWLIKALGLSVPLILTANWADLGSLWKDL